MPQGFSYILRIHFLAFLTIIRFFLSRCAKALKSFRSTHTHAHWCMPVAYLHLSWNRILYKCNTTKLNFHRWAKPRPSAAIENHVPVRFRFPRCCTSSRNMHKGHTPGFHAHSFVSHSDVLQNDTRLCWSCIRFREQVRALV